MAPKLRASLLWSTLQHQNRVSADNTTWSHLWFVAIGGRGCDLLLESLAHGLEGFLSFPSRLLELISLLREQRILHIKGSRGYHPEFGVLNEWWHCSDTTMLKIGGLNVVSHGFCGIIKWLQPFSLFHAENSWPFRAYPFRSYRAFAATHSFLAPPIFFIEVMGNENKQEQGIQCQK